MKIFDSLKCPQCKSPFVPINDNPRAPQQLFCGVVLCRECFDKERSLEKYNKTHRCTFTNCLSNIGQTWPPYFLNEILFNNSLQFSAENRGYILVKPIQLPECPICQEEYSLENEDQQPFRLRCNHLICNLCFTKIRSNCSTNPQESKFKVICPICQTECLRPKNGFDQKNILKDFLRELPHMTKQMEEMTKEMNLRDSRSRCDNCKENFPLPQLFRCYDCEEKICGGCAVRKHRSHTLGDLVMEEIDKIIAETEKAVSCQIHCYKEIFPPLHQDLIDNVSKLEKGLLSKISNIKKENIAKAEKESLDCRKFGDKFEEISEKYLPILREMNANLVELINNSTLGLVEVSIFQNSSAQRNQEQGLIEEVEEDESDDEKMGFGLFD